MMNETQGAPAPGSGPAATRVKLLVVPGRQREGGTALALLGRLAGPDGRAVAVAVMPNLAAALAQPADAPVIMLHQSAETALTDAMAQGTAPSDALAAWMTAMASHLALLRRNRRRITLVEAAALTGERAGGALARLAARLDLHVTPASGWEAAISGDFGGSPVVAALARICLADNAEVQTLSAELDALVLGPADGPAARTDGLADAAFAAHLTRDAEGAQFKAERDLLLDQIQHMQQQMEQSLALADRDARLDAAKRDLDVISCDLADTRCELAAVYASRSWRITGPLRRARLALKKKNNPDG